MVLDALSSRNMQVPGHVRLNQLTGHQQLLQQFAVRCPSSFQYLQHQRQQRLNVVAASSSSLHESIVHNERCSLSSMAGLPVVSSLHSSRNTRTKHRRRQPAASAAATSSPSVSISNSLGVLTQSSSQQQAVQPAADPASIAGANGQPHRQLTSSSTPAKVSSTLSSILSNRKTSQLQQQQQSQLPSQQQQQQQQQPPVFDPSALPIADRVKLLRHRIAARTRPRRQRVADRTHDGEMGRQVFSACNAAGIGAAAASYMVDHVIKARLRQDTLSQFVINYQKLAGAYGSPVVLQWLRRVPSVIRNAADVPARLSQLQSVMSSGHQQSADLQEVLELTRRCPQVLGVDAALIVPRARAICDLLRRPHSSASDILAAAPALLCMSHSTLASKVQQLQALAGSNTFWAETFAGSSTGSLAVLLTYSMQRYSRLQYLQEQGLTGSLRMATVLALSDDKMVERYPDYLDWLQQQQQQETQPQQQQLQQQTDVQHSVQDDRVLESTEVFHLSTELQLARVKQQLGVSTTARPSRRTAVV